MDRIVVMENFDARKPLNLFNGIVRVTINSKDDLIAFQRIIHDSGFASYEAEAFLKDFETVQSVSSVSKDLLYQTFFGSREFSLQTQNIEGLDEKLLSLVNELESIDYLFGILTTDSRKAVVFEMDGSDFTQRELN